MNTFDNLLKAQQEAKRSPNLRAAIALHEIEQNPLTEEEISMFGEFERAGLSHDERRAKLAVWIEQKFGVRAAG